MKYYVTISDGIKNSIENNQLYTNGYIELYPTKETALKMKAYCDTWILILDIDLNTKLDLLLVRWGDIIRFPKEYKECVR